MIYLRLVELIIGQFGGEIEVDDMVEIIFIVDVIIFVLFGDK